MYPRPELYNQITPEKKNNLRVVYTGRIYPGKRSPASLIKAIESLLDGKKIQLHDVVVEFYGVNTSAVIAELDAIKYPGIIKDCGYVSRDYAIQKQQSADFLLLLESGDSDSKGFLTGKIFEYLAAGRPILSIGSTADSAIARVLNETRCGRCYAEDSDALSEDLFNYLRGQSPIWFDPDLEAIQRYSRKYQADLLLQKIKTERHNLAFPGQVV
jgi:glycosyltransferase involved in cell wall biosynthesis